MTNSQRQQYGLGSFVKKAFKKVKKIAKSPLGKLGIGALALGIPWGAGGTGGFGGMFGSKSAFGKGMGFLRNRGMLGAAKSLARPAGMPGNLGWSAVQAARKPKGSGTGIWNWIKNNPKTAFLAGGAGLTGLSYLGGGGEDEEEGLPWDVTPSSIANIRNMAKNRDASLAFMPSSNYVQSGFYNAADGGRIGYERGRVVRPGGYQGDETDYEFLKPDNVVSNTESYEPPSKLMLMWNALKEQVNPEHWGNLLEFLSGQTGELGVLGGDTTGSGFGIKAITGNLDKAQGGIVGLANGGGAAEAQAEQMLRMEYQKYRNQGGTMSYQQFKMAVLQQAQQQGPMAQGQQAPQMAAYGGRMGYQNGEFVEDASMVEETPSGLMEENVEEVTGEPTREQLEALAMEIFQLRLEELDEEQLMVVYQAAMEQQPREEMMEENVEEVTGEPTREQLEALAMEIFQLRLEELDEEQLMVVYQAAMEQQPREEMMEEDIQFNPQMVQGQMAQPQMAAEGGLMSLGGMEKDYRAEGGFVPIGGEEKADDVPARLSKNEFVFTADAVRNAGGGDIDAGAEVMENVMNNLESGGQISEESQGAQGMYDQQQMLQSRIE